MTKSFVGVLVSLLMVAAAGIASEQSAYCEGFQQGYQSITGEHVSMPTCPAAPAGLPGATPFEQGRADGAALALRGRS
jgi:hypothetical protein